MCASSQALQGEHGSMMKCLDETCYMQPHELTFNYRLIRTRRVIEQACGRLKGRFTTMSNCSLNRIVFAADVALVCCALQNFCERWRCPTNNRWTVRGSLYRPRANDLYNNETHDNGTVVQNKLSVHVHRVRPL